MASGWTDVTSGSGGGGEIVGTDDAGADGFFEPVRASLIACAHAVFPLGGSRIIAIGHTTYDDVPEYLDFEVPAAKEGGFAYTAEIDVITAAAGTSITPRIWNETDSTVAATGSTSTSTSWVRDSFSFTPTVGKKYRLQAQRSNSTNNCWVIGFVQRLNT